MFYPPQQAKKLTELLDKNEFIKLSNEFILPDNSVVTICKIELTKNEIYINLFAYI